jgi:hypothetical protein
MNINTPACLDSLGRVFNKDDITGAKMNNFDEAEPVNNFWTLIEKNY